MTLRKERKKVKRKSLIFGGVFEERLFFARRARSVDYFIRKRRTLFVAQSAFRVKEKRADFEQKKEEKKEFW
jgi:hypothetical protein